MFGSAVERLPALAGFAELVRDPRFGVGDRPEDLSPLPPTAGLDGPDVVNHPDLGIRFAVSEAAHIPVLSRLPQELDLERPRTVQPLDDVERFPPAVDKFLAHSQGDDAAVLVREGLRLVGPEILRFGPDPGLLSHFVSPNRRTDSVVHTLDCPAQYESKAG